MLKMKHWYVYDMTMMTFIRVLSLNVFNIFWLVLMAFNTWKVAEEYYVGKTLYLNDGVLRRRDVTVMTSYS